MQYTHYYKSPLGNILLVEDNESLAGLWFEGQKYFANGLEKEHEEKFTSVLEQTSLWLDIYFSGKEPDLTPPIKMNGTGFQIKVWKKLLKIPYGTTATYGEIAKEITTQAQAVGGAIAHNKISIIIPCHRVIGTNGSFTGYSAGIDKKIKLLTLEKAIKNKNA